MKWTYWEANKPPGWAEMWQLDDDDAEVKRGISYKLILMRYQHEEAWRIKPSGSATIGALPCGLPEEELKALAIAMWRIG